MVLSLNLPVFYFFSTTTVLGEKVVKQFRFCLFYTDVADAVFFTYADEYADILGIPDIPIPTIPIGERSSIIIPHLPLSFNTL